MRIGYMNDQLQKLKVYIELTKKHSQSTKQTGRVVGFISYTFYKGKYIKKKGVNEP